MASLPNSEAETLFKEPERMAKLFAEMGRFNEELVKAGIMKSGDGLKPTCASVSATCEVSARH